MRIALPVRLIRQMDEVVHEGTGGFSTRDELIIDAIEQRILELTHGSIDEVATPLRLEVAVPQSPALSDPARLIGIEPASTGLSPPGEGFIVTPDTDVSRPSGDPLFGFHNRDYPALWALARLAELTTNEAVPLEAYVQSTIREAWKFGELLLANEERTGTKLTALFPTNREKRKPAEAAFRSFAIGEVRRDADNLATYGPLFEWKAAGLVDGRQQPLIGLTSSGWSLLRAMAGLTVDEPHSQEYARSFFDHIEVYAPGDMACFVEVLRTIGLIGATRQDVLEALAKAWPSWSSNEVSTNAAGYVARAREWGLMEMKQRQSKYNLTPYGVELLNGAN